MMLKGLGIKSSEVAVNEKEDKNEVAKNLSLEKVEDNKNDDSKNEKGNLIKDGK